MRLKGNWIEYERVMLGRHGKKKIEEMKLMAKAYKKYTTQDYQEIEAKYKAKFDALLTNGL